MGFGKLFNLTADGLGKLWKGFRYKTPYPFRSFAFHTDADSGDVNRKDILVWNVYFDQAAFFIYEATKHLDAYDSYVIIGQSFLIHSTYGFFSSLSFSGDGPLCGTYQISASGSTFTWSIKNPFNGEELLSAVTGYNGSIPAANISGFDILNRGLYPPYSSNMIPHFGPNSTFTNSFDAMWFDSNGFTVSAGIPTLRVNSVYVNSIEKSSSSKYNTKKAAMLSYDSNPDLVLNDQGLTTFWNLDPPGTGKRPPQVEFTIVRFEDFMEGQRTGLYEYAGDDKGGWKRGLKVDYGTLRGRSMVAVEDSAAYWVGSITKRFQTDGEFKLEPDTISETSPQRLMQAEPGDHEPAFSNTIEVVRLDGYSHNDTIAINDLFIMEVVQDGEGEEATYTYKISSRLKDDVVKEGLEFGVTYTFDSGTIDDDTYGGFIINLRRFPDTTPVNESKGYFHPMYIWRNRLADPTVNAPEKGNQLFEEIEGNDYSIYAKKNLRNVQYVVDLFQSMLHVMTACKLKFQHFFGNTLGFNSSFGLQKQLSTTFQTDNIYSDRMINSLIPSLLVWFRLEKGGEDKLVCVDLAREKWAKDAGKSGNIDDIETLEINQSDDFQIETSLVNHAGTFFTLDREEMTSATYRKKILSDTSHRPILIFKKKTGDDWRFVKVDYEGKVLNDATDEAVGVSDNNDWAYDPYSDRIVLPDSDWTAAEGLPNYFLKQFNFISMKVINYSAFHAVEVYGWDISHVMQNLGAGYQNYETSYEEEFDKFLSPVLRRDFGGGLALTDQGKLQVYFPGYYDENFNGYRTSPIMKFDCDLEGEADGGENSIAKTAIKSCDFIDDAGMDAERAHGFFLKTNGQVVVYEGIFYSPNFYPNNKFGELRYARGKGPELGGSDKNGPWAFSEIPSAPVNWEPMNFPKPPATQKYPIPKRVMIPFLGTLCDQVDRSWTLMWFMSQTIGGGSIGVGSWQFWIREGGANGTQGMACTDPVTYSSDGAGEEILDSDELNSHGIFNIAANAFSNLFVAEPSSGTPDPDELDDEDKSSTPTKGENWIVVRNSFQTYVRLKGNKSRPLNAKEFTNLYVKMFSEGESMCSSLGGVIFFENSTPKLRSYQIFLNSKGSYAEDHDFVDSDTPFIENSGYGTPGAFSLRIEASTTKGMIHVNRIWDMGADAFSRGILSPAHNISSSDPVSYSHKILQPNRGYNWSWGKAAGDGEPAESDSGSVDLGGAVRTLSVGMNHDMWPGSWSGFPALTESKAQQLARAGGTIGDMIDYMISQFPNSGGTLPADMKAVMYNEKRGGGFNANSAFDVEKEWCTFSWADYWKSFDGTPLYSDLSDKIYCQDSWTLNPTFKDGWTSKEIVVAGRMYEMIKPFNITLAFTFDNFEITTYARSYAEYRITGKTITGKRYDCVLPLGGPDSYRFMSTIAFDEVSTDNETVGEADQDAIVTLSTPGNLDLELTGTDEVMRVAKIRSLVGCIPSGSEITFSSIPSYKTFVSEPVYKTDESLPAGVTYETSQTVSVALSFTGTATLVAIDDSYDDDDRKQCVGNTDEEVGRIDWTIYVWKVIEDIPSEMEIEDEHDISIEGDFGKVKGGTLSYASSDTTILSIQDGAVTGEKKIVAVAVGTAYVTIIDSDGHSIQTPIITVVLPPPVGSV